MQRGAGNDGRAFDEENTSLGLGSLPIPLPPPDPTHTPACFAQVADFGLAIKMDAHTTHVSEFQ